MMQRILLLVVLLLLFPLAKAQAKDVRRYPGDNDPNRIYRTRFELTASDIMSASSRSRMVLHGVPGYVILPYSCQWDRLAGSAYTLNGVVAITLEWQGLAAESLANALTAGFLDADGPGTFIHVYRGQGPVSDSPVSALVSKNIVVGTVLGTDLSGGTGSMIVTFWYRLFKIPQ